MSQLGVIVGSRLAPTSRGVPTNTGTAFITGHADQGDPLAPFKVTSVKELETTVGARAAGNQGLYDGVDSYFREGGQEAWVSTYTASGSDTLQDALDSFKEDLGPGQVMVLDETPTSDVQTALNAHAKANNRVALFDVTSNATIATMQALGDGLPMTDPDYGALFGPWVKVPPAAGITGGSDRTVPASVVIAALCARVDALGNPNRAAAGRDFPLQYVTGFALDIGKTDRQTLLDHAVNTMADIYGVLENYGFQTSVDQDPNNPYWQFNVSRLRMYIIAKCKEIGENYMFKTIDGRGRLAASLKTDIDAMLLDLYRADALFGATPQDAFATTVSSSINTASSIAQGQLNAVVEIIPSEHAKAINIDAVTIPVTGAIGR